MNNNLKKPCKESRLYFDFFYKIYNYYLISFNEFTETILKNYQYSEDNFLQNVLIRGIFLIEKLFIYQIYISNYDIPNLQNIAKKIIDLYLKFIDQLIAMNNNICLNIKDAEIFLYKKIIDKSINNFSNLKDIDKQIIILLKENNKYFYNNIIIYLSNYGIYNIDSKLILDYHNQIFQYL